MGIRRFASLVYGLSANSVTFARVMQPRTKGTTFTPQVPPKALGPGVTEQKPASWSGLAEIMRGSQALKR